MQHKQAANLMESFVSVGTPLPSLATSKGDTGEFKPVWEQEVVDEKGRRRFHGAFTGGFTAGYFGTAGSKEGWAPSTFKSSRGSRAGKSAAQAAEDLMDEEDLVELANSRTLSTAAAYSAPLPSAYDPLLGNIPSANPTAPLAAAKAFASLIEPASSRIGAQLMRRMGWRDGQGVGPRLTLQQRRRQAAELGIKLEEDEDDEGEATKHYFAPLDRPLVTVKEIGIASDRGWGLGYKPGPSIPTERSRTSRKDMAYGGARLTGDNEDDDDVYEVGDSNAWKGKAAKGWGVIDIEDDDEGITLLGMDSIKSRKRTEKPKTTGTAPKPLQTFHDGTSVTSGFVLFRDVLPGSTITSMPPSAPRGWTPNPKRLWDENTPPIHSAKGKEKQLDASDRGTLLGEPAPPPIPKSVFDYLSSRDKERLAALSQGKPVASTLTPSVAEPDATLLIPPLDKPTALAALKGFQPFSSNSTSPDSVRQARYTLYLQLQAGLLPPSNATLPFGPRKLSTGAFQTISQLNRELDDYMRAARVFKPVSGMLAGRFTSGGAGGVGPTVEPGLYQPPEKAVGPGNFVTSAVEEPVVEKLSTAQSAVRQGLFGPLTRMVDGFRPGKLVCKRFGVQDPWSGEGVGEDDRPGGAWKAASKNGYGLPSDRKNTNEVLGKSSMDALMQSSGFRRLQPEDDAISAETEWIAPTEVGGAPCSKPSAQELPTLENVGLGDDERQGEETLTYTKAPKDIFAAIFADSDDDDDDENEDDEEDTLPAPSKTVGVPVLVAAEAPTLVVVPSPSALIADVPLSLDNLASYRPTFSATRAVEDLGADSSKKRSKKDKRKSKSGMSTLSFDVGEEGEEAETLTVKSKKRKREKEVKVQEQKVSEGVTEETMEWVEVEKKPVFSAPTLAPSDSSIDSPIIKLGGRTRAADLY